MRSLVIQNLTLALLALAVLSCQTSPSQKVEAPKTSEEASLGNNGLIKNSKQLTFDGLRSGEGYFSADGKKMIFQSERDPQNPFYQIYLLDFETGNTSLVSTGSGKTTCAWIHPTGKKIMYSSTHLDPQFKSKVQEEQESRKSQQKKKYSWSYDETYDIFEADIHGKKVRRLTAEKGYDAEGSYSPDGKWIVFASNRAGYRETLSPEEQKLFAQDPSYMMDIYIMDANGKNVKRLTDSRGYDGGPFFSSDGKKITWRRFAANGQTAEIYTMNVDGSDQKAVTHMKVMSWAPFFHPSGDYIVFTTNKLGYHNFELYIVDSEGKKEPVRVTFLGGFDGLPVFTPDGKKLSWTRTNDKGESQIFMADWDDSLARELLGLPMAAPRKAQLNPELNVEDAKLWVSYFASKEMAGRQTGGESEKIYTKSVADFFKELNLKPAEGSDYLQSFEFTSNVKLGSNNKLQIKVKDQTKSFTVEKDFLPLSFSAVGEFKEAPVAFAGYGIVAPANGAQAAYDSYKDLDVKGKWVLVFRDLPEDIPSDRRVHLNIYARLHHKAMVARNQGAVGLLLVNGPNSAAKKFAKLSYEGGFAEAGLPVVSVSDPVAAELLKDSGKSLKEWQSLADKGETVNKLLPQSFVSSAIDLNFEKAKGLNVLAKLRVPGAKTTLVIGAHGDHLGHGEKGSSLAKDGERGAIHFGADDNASGMAGVLELAHSLSQAQAQGTLKLKQNVIFAIWSGEELGLLGSTQYLNKTKEKISAYLNMDMIGRLRSQLVLQGVASAKEWKKLLESELLNSKVQVVLQDDPYVPSDAMAFYMKHIPSVSFFTGAHGEYHSPRDTADTLNYEGLITTVELVKNLALKLASQNPALTYQNVESSKTKLEGRSFRIYLGTIPDYTQEGVKGVRITGTSKSSPAEKAGLKAGDVIVELASTKIENLYDYVYCLQAMKAGSETTIKVQRDGKLVELSILPQLKE